MGFLSNSYWLQRRDTMLYKLANIKLNREVKMSYKYDRTVKAIKNKDYEFFKKNVHHDFMLIRESGLVSRENVLAYIEEMFNGDTVWLDFKFCYEDEDTLVWKDLVDVKSERRRLLVTNCEAYKDGEIWRSMLNVKNVSKDLEKIL